MLVAMNTASISDSSNSSNLEYPFTDGYCRVILLSFLGSRSQQAENSHLSLFASTRARCGPQYPKPTSPTLNMSASPFFDSNDPFGLVLRFKRSWVLRGVVAYPAPRHESTA